MNETVEMKRSVDFPRWRGNWILQPKKLKLTPNHVPLFNFLFMVGGGTATELKMHINYIFNSLHPEMRF